VPPRISSLLYGISHLCANCCANLTLQNHVSRNTEQGKRAHLQNFEKTRFKHCAYVQNKATILLFITYYDSSVLGKINLNLFYFSYICNHQYLKSAICFLWVNAKTSFEIQSVFILSFLHEHGQWTLGYNDHDVFEKLKKARVKMGLKCYPKTDV